MTRKTKLFISLSFLFAISLIVFISCGDDSDSGYSVTITDFPSGSGIIQFEPDNDNYATGDTVIIEAFADADHEFRRWLIGTIYYDTNPLEIVIDTADVEITAYYYTLEGEPECYEDYIDSTNGGCDWAFEDFRTIQSGEVILGEMGVYHSGGYRDTDWYEYTATTNELLIWKVTAADSMYARITNGTDGCGYETILVEGSSDQGDTLMLTAEVEPGTYWLLAAPGNWNADIECGSEYTAWLNASSIAVANMVEHEIDPDNVKAAKSE